MHAGAASGNVPRAGQPQERCGQFLHTTYLPFITIPSRLWESGRSLTGHNIRYRGASLFQNDIVGLNPFALLLFWSQGTLDVGLIDSVCASDNPDRWVSFLSIAAFFVSFFFSSILWSFCSINFFIHNSYIAVLVVFLNCLKNVINIFLFIFEFTISNNYFAVLSLALFWEIEIH